MVENGAESVECCAHPNVRTIKYTICLNSYKQKNETENKT